MNATGALNSLLSERGLELPKAARKARLSPATLRRYWREGGVNAHTAARLAHVLGCPAQIFLWGFETHILSGGAAGRPNEGISLVAGAPLTGSGTQGPQPLVNSPRPRRFSSILTKV